MCKKKEKILTNRCRLVHKKGSIHLREFVGRARLSARGVESGDERLEAEMWEKSG